MAVECSVKKQKHCAIPKHTPELRTPAELHRVQCSVLCMRCVRYTACESIQMHQHTYAMFTLGTNGKCRLLSTSPTSRLCSQSCHFAWHMMRRDILYVIVKTLQPCCINAQQTSRLSNIWQFNQHVDWIVKRNDCSRIWQQMQNVDCCISTNNMPDRICCQPTNSPPRLHDARWRKYLPFDVKSWFNTAFDTNVNTFATFWRIYLPFATSVELAL